MRRSNKAGERRSAAQMHALASVRREIVLSDSSGGRKYLREFAEAFRSFDKAITREELDRRVNDASILLIGDYHALAASQRYAASLVEEISSKRRVVVCVEAILSRDQSILDSWWRRDLAEQELRKRLRFDREWGYEWEPFYELLSTARDHAEAIYGLDCMPREDMRRIRSRDRHAVAKITEARRQHPDAAIVVLFGESHLAPEHMPKLVKTDLANDSVLTILQNVDALYWQAVADNAAAVSVGPDTVCVFNSSPLEKYESYRLCLERWNSDDQADFAPALYNVIFSLARTLGFRLDSPHNGTQPKYLGDSLPEVVTVADDGSELFKQFAGENSLHPRSQQIRDTENALKISGSCYVPETNQFFIREFNLPWVAREAARFLHRACRGLTGPVNLEVSDTVAHLGARLLCPEASQKDHTDTRGEELYQAYIAGQIPRAAVRRIFLRGEMPKTGCLTGCGTP